MGRRLAGPSQWEPAAGPAAPTPPGVAPLRPGGDDPGRAGCVPLPDDREPPLPPLALDAALALAVAVAALLATTGLLFLYHALNYPPITLGVPLAVALYTAAAQGHLRLLVVLVSAMASVTLAWRGVIESEPVVPLVEDLIREVALLAAVLRLGETVRSRRPATGVPACGARGWRWPWRASSRRGWRGECCWTAAWSPSPSRWHWPAAPWPWPWACGACSPHEHAGHRKG